MITAGIDVGLKNTKVVILKDGEIVAKSTATSGGAKRGSVAATLYDVCLKEAGISASDVEKVVSTGAGKYDVEAADSTITEPVADAHASRYLFAEGTSIVDLGANQIRVVTLGEGDKIEEVVLNQKCAGNIGMYLEFLARRLGLSIAELSAIGDEADGAVVNDGCCVFSELDALGLLNRGYSVKQTAAAVLDAMSVRISSVLDDKIRPSKTTTVVIGGLTKNTAVMDRLEARTGIKFLKPADAEYGSALGSALIAAGK